MSARYDAMVEAWERANGKPCPLSVRRQFQASAYASVVARTTAAARTKRNAELSALIQAQAKDRAAR